ncbi:unnamed protein product [Lampetra fluviatilis]
MVVALSSSDLVTATSPGSSHACARVALRVTESSPMTRSAVSGALQSQGSRGKERTPSGFPVPQEHGPACFINDTICATAPVVTGEPQSLD